MIFDFLMKSSPASMQITTAKQLADFLWGGGGSSAGVAVTPHTAMHYAPVFSCVKVLAESVGALPLHLYRQNGKSREKAVDHPLFDLLHVAPNELQTAQEFWEMCVGHLALRGNFYAYINRIDGGKRVAELLPWHPGAVTPVLTSAGQLVYRVQLLGGGTEIYLPRDVLHIKLFSMDGISGLSPIGYMRESIGLGIATEQHGARLFGNGARPGGILTSATTLTKQDQDRLSESWKERHQGVENAHRVAILHGGMKWEQMGLSSEDAQFLESRQYQRSEVAGFYRVPPHMIGDLTRSTNNNIEQQSLEFVTYGLMPILTRIEQRAQFQLFSKEERQSYYAKFNVGGLLRGDMKSRSQFYKDMVGTGLMSPNEVREFEDMNPRDGGDAFLTPMNMSPSGQDAQPAAANP